MSPVVDDDLSELDREALIAEVKRLRAGIRSHRDSSGHELCWHHPTCGVCYLNEPIPSRPFPSGRSSCADVSSTGSRWIGSSRTRRALKSNSSGRASAQGVEHPADLHDEAAVRQARAKRVFLDQM